jgi:hypothetical protein
MSPKNDDPDFDPRELSSPLPFSELMVLDPLDDNGQQRSIIGEPERVYRFRSRSTPFPPGEGAMAFGGHVYGQSAYAASKTVNRGFVLHVSLFWRSFH